MMVFGALLIAMFVITILVLVQRFSKNLLGDEGYLIFTLPVNSTQILLSKYLVALMWTLLSGIVAFLSFSFITLIPMISDSGVNFAEVFDVIKYFFNELPLNNHYSFIFSVFFTMFLGYSSFIFTIYLSLSIGQLPTFSKNRVITAFISFIAINIVSSFLQNLLSITIFANRTEEIILEQGSPNFNGVISIVNDGMLFGIGFNLLLLIGLFFATKYILDRNLNLE